MSRERQRLQFSIVLVVLGGFGTVAVLSSPWHVPARPLLLYLTSILALAGALGLFGVNIFRGGSLDPRIDGKDRPEITEQPVLTFQQRRGLQRRRVVLFSSGIDVTWSSPIARHRYWVPFEEVLQHPTESTEQSVGLPTYRLALLAFGMFFAFIAPSDGSKHGLIGGVAVAVFCFGVAAGDWLLEHFPRKPLIVVSSGTPAVILYANKPSERAVRDFVTAIHKHAALYIRTTYGQQRPGDPLATIEQLFDLFQRGAISESEFQGLKAIALQPRDTVHDSDGPIVH